MGLTKSFFLFFLYFDLWLQITKVSSVIIHFTVECINVLIIFHIKENDIFLHMTALCCSKLYLLIFCVHQGRMSYLLAVINNSRLLIPWKNLYCICVITCSLSIKCKKGLCFLV